MSIRMGAVALDCDDPLLLARFWASLLEGDVVVELAAFAAVKLPGLWITAQRVENHRRASRIIVARRESSSRDVARGRRGQAGPPRPRRR